MEILYINKKRKRRRFKKSVLVAVLIILLLAFITMMLMMHFGGSVGKVGRGRIETSLDVSAVIIRNESVISSGEYEVCERFFNEGSEVAEGERVMDVYKLGYNREATLALLRVEQEIYEAQLGVLGEARDVELRNYDNAVEEAEHALSNAVLSGETESVLDLKNRLTSLLSERSEYLRSTVQETEKLRSLYRLQSERASTVADSRVELLSEADGIVSYYYDDYSVALNADKLSMVTADLIDSIVSKSGKSPAWIGSSKTSAYRLVSGGEWYLAFTTAASMGMRVVSGETYPLTIEGYGEYEGVGETSFVSGSRVVNIIKLDAELGALVDARTVHAKIRFGAEGIKVEKRAVQFENGEPFVEVMVDGKRTGVYVYVFAEDGGSAIVGARSSENTSLGEGGKYWIPKRNVFKK